VSAGTGTVRWASEGPRSPSKLLECLTPCTGMGLVLFEVLGHSVSPSILVLAAAMIGLPSVLREQA
jgi:hypothetical protein